MASPPMNARKPDPPSVSGRDEEEERKKRERAAVAARVRKCRAKKKAKEALEAATRASTPAQAPALEYASTPARNLASSAEMLHQFVTSSNRFAATNIDTENLMALAALLANEAAFVASVSQATNSESRNGRLRAVATSLANLTAHIASFSHMVETSAGAPQTPN